MTHESPTKVLESFHKRWLEHIGESITARAPVYLTGCATTDITQPYHSHCYLAGSLRQAKQPFVARDLGIEFWHYVISPGVIQELRKECLKRFRTAAGDERGLLLFFADLLEDSERFQRAFNALRDKDKFYQLEHYLPAVQELNALPRLLTLLHQHAEYRTFSSASPPGYEDNFINLASIREKVPEGLGVEVLDFFYEFHAQRIAELGPCLVGMTIPFLSQLEHSLLLGHSLRKLDVEVVIGGPMCAKIYKYADDVNKLGALSFASNYLVTGEGETLISKLAASRRSGEAFTDYENLVDLDHPKPLKRIHFENVDALPSPDYSLWDYDLYASPEPGGLYSPTRGCYWNKCSFCDYGLAVDGPTSPWRTRSPERVYEDLSSASAYVRHFFFAVDVLSPSYAMKLSNEIIHKELDIKWMADFRLESTFDIAKVSVFQESGCLGAAFGMESTDQAVLDSLHKGTDSNRLSDVVGAFADVGIPVQLMGFTGFPGETREQAEETFSTSLQLLDKAATVALGKFGLSPGSRVATHPEEFDVKILTPPPKGDSIPWDLEWELGREIETYPVDEYGECLRLTRGFAYPFLGATSTLHSLLYFEKYPRSPFPIPSWSYQNMSATSFHIIPFYQRGSTEADGEALLQSGLTGRALAMSSASADTIDTIFATSSTGWPLLSGGSKITPNELQLLDFLVEHSLALFLPAGSRQ